LEDLFSKSINRILNNTQFESTHLAFWKLLVLGSFGPFSQKWVQTFKDFYALHLLVLSGSQLNGLIGFWRGLTLGIPSKYRSLVFGGMLFSNLSMWLIATSWTPPLVRASILCLVQFLIPRLSSALTISLSLSLHIVLFPGHVFSRGFFLSWLCYLCLLLSQKLFLRFPLLFAHLACWLMTWYLFDYSFNSFGHLILVFLGSLFLSLAFEWLLLPFIGLVLGLAFITITLGEKARIFDAFFSPFLKGAMQLIVVVEAIFRYILKYDL
jgi:hypothetical protein